jgi:hypothetical protein
MLIHVPPDLTGRGVAQFVLDCWEVELRAASAALGCGDVSAAEEAFQRAAVWSEAFLSLAPAPRRFAFEDPPGEGPAATKP